MSDQGSCGQCGATRLAETVTEKCAKGGGREQSEIKGLKRALSDQAQTADFRRSGARRAADPLADRPERLLTPPSHDLEGRLLGGALEGLDRPNERQAKLFTMPWVGLQACQHDQLGHAALSSRNPATPDATRSHRR
jgi:hypothetical protein